MKSKKINPIHYLLKYNYPTKVKFWDNSERITSRSIYKLFKHWRKKPERIEESDKAYTSYSGGDVIDIGSYLGWYAVLLCPKAKPGSNFICIEPNPEAYPRLLQNLRALAILFPTLKFWAIPQPIGNGGFVSLVHHKGYHPTFHSSSIPDTNSTKTFLLDNLCDVFNIKPSFIKVDVEGAEAYVLEGAIETLKNASTWFIELHPTILPEGIDPEKIESLMESNDFKKIAVDKSHIIYTKTS